MTTNRTVRLVISLMCLSLLLVPTYYALAVGYYTGSRPDQSGWSWQIAGVLFIILNGFLIYSRKKEHAAAKPIKWRRIAVRSCVTLIAVFILADIIYINRNLRYLEAVVWTIFGFAAVYFTWREWSKDGKNEN